LQPEVVTPTITSMKTINAVTTNQTLERVGHCLYRSAKSRIYYAILKRTGKQIKRSLKTTDRALAGRRLSELQEKASKLSGSKNAKITFADIGKQWLQVVVASMKTSSHSRQVKIVKSLSKFFGGITVRKITKADVEKWATARSKEASARTFNYERQTFIRILDYAMRDGLIMDNPARIIKRRKQPKHKVVIPTKEQFKALIEAIRNLKATAHEAAILCEFLAYSGCRLGEAVEMTWEDVNFDLKQFTVTGGEFGTKNNEVRTVPLFPSLEKFLLKLRNSLPQTPKHSDRIFSIQNAKTAITSACRNAGLPHFTHHHLRHFFCSNAIEAGIDFKAIAGWLGHKDGGLLVAMTYGHLRDEHSAAMARKMTFAVAGDNLSEVKP